MNNTEAGVTTINPGVKITFRSLKLENELLKANAVVDNIAMGQMSKEICDLNNQLQNLLDELKEMQ